MSETTNGRLRGTALWVAIAVAVVLLGGAWWAAQVDLNSELDRNSGPLKALSTVYKVLIFGGLWVVARRLGSSSVKRLALLVLALIVGGLAIDITAALHRIAARLASVLPVSEKHADEVLLFGALALIAVWLLAAAYRAANERDRSLVMTLIGLLVLVGVFVGPVNAIASLGINREWLFAEDFGQVVSLAVLGGYVSGLVAATGAGRE